MRYKKEVTGFGILIGMWIMVVVSCLIIIINSLEIMGIYILLGFGVVMTLVYMSSLINTLKYRNECKNIVMNGIRVQGRIVDYSIETYRIAGKFRRIYRVSVTYLDPYTSEEKTILTPDLSFNPVSSLGDTSCSVYILNELYYVTDFVPRKAGLDNIWGKEFDTLEKKELKKVLIYITIFIIFFVLVCLCCMGIIRF